MTNTPLRVLYVEDSPHDVKLLAHELHRAGYAPSGETVESREEFLTHLNPKLDLILSDYTMPGFNGLEALRLMRERKIDLPFIFVSGTIGEDLAVAAVQEGAADYLIKDRLGRLGSAVKQALARRKLKEEKLAVEQTAARLAAIVAASNDAIVAKTLDGTITSWNAAAQRMYGFSAEEIIGKNVSALYPAGRRKSDAPESFTEIMTRLSNGVAVPAYETVRVRKDGRRIEVLLSISPIVDSDGVVSGASAIAHDITQRKRSERFLKAEQAVTVLLTESLTLEEAAPKLLQTIAECLRWEVAVLWTVDREANVLRKTHLWHSPWAEAKFIEALGRQAVLPPGVGIAGRVWNQAELFWQPGITDEAHSWESSPITSEGLRGGFGFPVRSSTGMMGVIEFYNPELREPDESLISALDNIATQISHFCHRHQTAAALRASEEQFRQLADAMPQIVWTAQCDGRVTYFNERWYEYTGAPRDADPEGTWRSVVHPDDLDGTISKWADAVQRGTGFETEIRLLNGKTKEYRWVLTRAIATRNSDGNVVCWYGTNTDIDDQKRHLDNLRISEERFRNLVIALPGAVYTTDAAGRITLFNEPAAKLWGRRPTLGEDRWCGSWKIYNPDGTPLPIDECPMAVTLREGRGVRGQEIIVERPDGSKSHVLPHPEPMFSPSGEVVGAVNMLVDITHMRQLEEQYRQAQKMEAVGRLAGGVAHDFNNLLTIINGYGELILGTLKADDRNCGSVREIIRAGERATSLTRQLLAFSRQQVLHPQVLNLNALLADSEKMLRRLIGEDVELKTVKDPALGNIKADPGQMEQVLLNLAVNARDAMPRGGTLTVTTQNVEVFGGHEGLSGSYILLVVSDSGCGMDKSIQSRIFEPFFTTKGTKGTGLGLATVFGIVKQSHGGIEVTSEPDQGATFKIYIPRVDAPVSSAKSSSGVPDRLRGSETILLAEDEEGVRTLTRHLLQASGYTVLEATNGTDAIRIVEKQGDTIDLLMTDVVMPRMSGRELADQLAVKHPKIKVLFLSGYTDDAIVHHGVYHDKTHFLQKPFSPAGLALKVREVLNAL